LDFNLSGKKVKEKKSEHIFLLLWGGGGQLARI